ncbi:MAG: UbiA family prenyltransferase [Candidatus Altiarchaeota archaeon]
MEKFNALLELVRPRNMVISFLGVIVGMLLVSTDITLDMRAIAAAASAMLILGGGNALNDYYDLDADKINRPKRPIPSGRITRGTAKLSSILLFLAGLLIALLINIYCLLLAALNSLVLAAYARYSKKAFLVSNLAVSYLSASVFIYGAISIYQTMRFNPLGLGTLAILIVSSFFMTLSREIIKDVEDVKGDKKIDGITLPTEVGIQKSREIAITVGVTSMVVSLIPIFIKISSFNRTAYALFITAANLIFILSYLKEPGKSQKLLVLGMATSLIAFLAGRLTV